MKFHFIGGMDCPDWIIAEVALLNTLTPNLFRTWCVIIIHHIKFFISEWSLEEMNRLKDRNEIDLRSIKAMVSALSFIIEESTKSNCPVEDLENEMLQIGFSTAHVNLLTKLYSQEQEQLSKTMNLRFMQAPSFAIRNIEKRDDNVTMKVETTDRNILTLSIDNKNCQLFKHNMKVALEVLEPYINNK